ncbi:HAD-IIB family hydrolase [Parasphingorhabdus sp.]|uniref:HAD-IIB family hydrolase n=1 Tax=Parasphingorhabdus sp. TaxID=2709688 RepID=UPI003002BC50
MPTDTVHPIIFTDLDGTLLDHKSYSVDPADRLIRQLSESAIATVIPVTSKTLAELQSLQRSLPIPETASVTENGSLIFSPSGVPFRSDGKAHELLTGISYSAILAALGMLPRSFRQHITGFSDMSVNEVANATGLSITDAELAKQRNATEPFLWTGSDAALNELRSLMADRNISIQQGGRFYHFTGPATKSLAMNRIMSAFEAQSPERKIVSIALGDGPNDLSMIEAADIGVVMPNPEGVTITSSKPHVRKAPTSGPHGWCLAIREIIAELGLILPES